MDLKLTAKFLDQRSYVYQQALKDFPQSNHSSIDHYLNQLRENKKIWLSDNRFYDRELVVHSIRNILPTKGQLVCLLRRGNHYCSII